MTLSSLSNLFLIYSDIYNIHITIQQMVFAINTKYKIIVNKNITTFGLYLLVVLYLSLSVENVFLSHKQDHFSAQLVNLSSESGLKGIKTE